MTLKKFLKYFCTMCKLKIAEFPEDDDDGNILFEGYVFDKGAKKKLKKLYKENYVLDRNSEGDAVLMYVYTNEHGVHLPVAQINVRKGE